jgi:pterin-4a-carbinolamine dehydratase
MTETLAEKTCTPCRGGVPPLGRDEALRFQAQAPDWELRDEAHRIERTFRFRNQAHGRQPLLVKAAHSEAEQLITRIHI